MMRKQEEYDNYSRQISKLSAINKSSNNNDISDINFLSQRRALIRKKAEGKNQQQ